ncbi:MAG: hypothetical protein ACXQTW_02175 [Candidatus Methanospirareceae archaeon]
MYSTYSKIVTNIHHYDLPERRGVLSSQSGGEQSRSEQSREKR